MFDGYGVALGAALLFITLLGMAFLLSIFLIGVFVSRRWIGSVPRILRSLSIFVVIGGMLLVGPFMIVLFNDASVLVTGLLILVVLPLGVTPLYLYIVTDLSRLDTIATTGLAWSIPFLIGFSGLVGVDLVMERTFGRATVEQLGVGWILSAVWVIITVFGTFQLSKYVSKWLVPASDLIKS